MAKKGKVGKQRKDKYYRLAKEAGIDLVPIKSINNSITLQGDITTEKARQMIKKELSTWEADCVLHDGAPNVGLNWLHDAFQQNLLTLSALRLATQILAKNGWFVTKIFRSKDYEALIRVFEKLFKTVHVWKPAASRLESAEIFVACEKYLKPAKVDPALLDSKSVFKDANPEPAPPKPQDMLQFKKKEKKKKAEGYAEGATVLFTRITATEFLRSKSHLELLGTANEVAIDDPVVENSVHTTDEIRECLKDIKVCGPREVRAILQWRKKLQADYRKEHGANADEDDEGEQVEQQPLTLEEIEAREVEEIDALIANAKTEEKAVLKRKKRRMLRERARERQRKQLKMIIEGDRPDIPEQIDLFSLKTITKARHIKKLVGDDAVTAVASSAVDEEDDHPDTSTSGGSDDDDDAGRRSDDEQDEVMSDDDDQNPLLVTEETGLKKHEKLDRRTEQWFSRDGLADLLDDDDDHVAAVEKHVERLQKRKHAAGSDHATAVANDVNAVTTATSVPTSAKAPEANSAIGTDEVVGKGAFDDDETSSSDSNDDDDDPTAARRTTETTKNFSNGDGFEIVPADAHPKIKRRRLDPETLAMGEMMVYSSKTRRDLEEWGWNRFTNNDDGLPDWFVDDEKKHYRKELPVTKDQVTEYRKRARELNARPIKKVVEAKMRKRKKQVGRLNKAKKRAEQILENPEMEQREKIREMKKVYNKASQMKKQDVTYQVMTKGKRGSGAPPKGPYKVVDKRLKKDNRKKKETSRKKQWKSKSSTAKRAENEKMGKQNRSKKSNKRTVRRAKRGKP